MQSRKSELLKFNIVELENFRQRFPWIGGDLQTIRDTFCINFKLNKNTERILIPVNAINSDQFKEEFIKKNRIESAA